MWTRHRKPPRFKLLVFPAVAIAISVYFFQSATTGRYGLEAKKDYEAQIASLFVEHDDVVHKRQRLERRVALLNDGTLERDMIDEQARRVLGLTRADEIVLLQSSN